MIPVESQEATDGLPKAQSKPSITQLDCPGMVASTNGQKDDVCDTVMPPAPNEDVSSRIPEISQPCVNLAEAASTELPLNVEEALIREETNRTSHDADAILDQEILEEFAFPFPDPASTLEIQGSANSDQDAQGTCSPQSSSALSQNITTAVESGPQAEQLASRAASSVNPSEVAHEGGVQPPNISYGGSTVNTLAGEAMGQNPQTHFPLFSDPFEYELEKLRREEENIRKNFEETTSELMAELERKMAEVRSEYDGKFQELDAEYNAKAMENKANRSLVEMNSLLANAFMCKCTDQSAATYLPAVRARSSQHSIQQRQAVQTNTHIISTAPSRPSVTAAEAPIPNPSRPLLHFLRCTTTQPRPISQQAAVQSSKHMNSTALPRPSVTAEALPLHSPRSNMPQPRPPPLISNLTPSSPPPVYGIVRAPAPHLQAFRASQAPNASAAASTTYPRRLAQEQQQQPGNSNGDVVCLSDDDE